MNNYENYDKNSVKLLEKLDNKDNTTVFYTEFDGRFEVGDILYISVTNNNNGLLSAIDSLANKKGYKLLHKKGNMITLDIPYSYLDSLGITNLPTTTNSCYIGRIYINNTLIKRGNVNNTIMKNTTLEPSEKGDIDIIQASIVSIKEVGGQKIINDIDFTNKYSDDEQILKMIYDVDSDKLRSYYTDNNRGFGISSINITSEYIILSNCNISAGVFKFCELRGIDNIIDNGYFDECDIDGYIINNGYFNDNVLNVNNIWNYGSWYNSNTSLINYNFHISEWNDGIWVDGVFPNTAKWHNGVFRNGTFMGDGWDDGEFQNGLFTETLWRDGIFGGGIIERSLWLDGNFYGGKMYDCEWGNGTFHDGEMSATEENTKMIWHNGLLKNGQLNNIDWENGTVDNGSFNTCLWRDGIFNDGELYDTNWLDGKFYNGLIRGVSSGTRNLWMNGVFYNGKMVFMQWETGVVHNGYIYGVLWKNGFWYNGTAVNSIFINVQWYNGIFDSSENKYKYIPSSGGNDAYEIIQCNGVIQGGVWYDGVFNNGQFGENDTSIETIWKGGNFYNGIYNGDKWENGLFYNGKQSTFKYIPERNKTRKPYSAYNIDFTVKDNNQLAFKTPKKGQTNSKYITPRTD